MTLFQIGAMTLLVMVLVPATATAASLASTLEGRWTAVAAERNGLPASELNGNQISFDKAVFRISHDGALIYGGSFTVDDTASPVRIDFAIKEGEAKGQSWLGIARIENEMLTICDNAPDGAAPRPSEFTTSPGSGHVCLTFRR